MKLKFYEKYRILLIQEVLFCQWFGDGEKFTTDSINPATKQEENPSVWAIYTSCWVDGRLYQRLILIKHLLQLPITWAPEACWQYHYYNITKQKLKKNLVKYDRRKSILVLSVIWPIPLSSPTDNNIAFNNRKKLLLAILGSHFIWVNIEA